MEWVVYAIIAAALIVPSLLAWKYGRKAAALEEESRLSVIYANNKYDALLAQHEQLKREYQDYVKIIQTSGDDPATIIDRLRDAGKIPGA